MTVHAFSNGAVVHTFTGGAPGPSGVGQARRHGYVAPDGAGVSIDYIGIGPKGADEDAAVWTVTRQTVSASGVGTLAFARNVSWTGYASHDYT